MKIIDIWINCPDAQTAEDIASRLLMDRLVACSNIYPSINSTYHWQGKIESDTEIPLLVKTRESLFEPVCKRVSELHPYDTPGIMGVPVALVNDEYARWLENETADPRLS